MASPERLAIVGGGPAGHAVAKAFREAGGGGEVLLLTAEDRRPYRRPPLTKEYLRGELGESDLPLEGPGWYEAHGVELRCGATVGGLDPLDRVLTMLDGERIGYRDCVLCTGSEPARPPIAGVADPRVHVLRTVGNATRLAQAVDPGTTVCVIGAGFIGCEAAASLSMRGADVTVIAPEPAPQSGRLGDEVGAVIRGWLEELGIVLRAGEEVAEVLYPEAAGARLRLRSGEEITCDEVVLGAGVAPRVGLAELAGAGLEGGAVVTDASMRTAVAGLWCAGDIAFAHNAAAGRRLRVEHWGEALAHGAVAGAALAGRRSEWAQAPGFWSTIGRRTLKQAAWGDGWDETRLDGDADGFTAWYGRDGRVVGVLTHDRDDDYESGRELVEAGAPWPPDPDTACDSIRGG